MYWPAILITVAIAVVLIVLLIRQNRKDEKEWIDELNNDYKKEEEDELEL